MPLGRRRFLGLSLGAALGSRLRAHASTETDAVLAQPLRSPRYDQVTLAPGIARAQQANALAVLNSFDTDALLKPVRLMGDQPAPGRVLGGWYAYDPAYTGHGNTGFAPAHAFGQWTSAMARFSAAQNDAAAADCARQLQTSLGESITPEFYERHRFPAYVLDKFNCGLIDAHRLLQSPDAFAVADKVRRCALASLPGHAIEREIPWRSGHLDDPSYAWDESYTIPENLYLLYTLGAGDEYRSMARDYLLDKPFFEPLSRGENVLGGLHAYSHINAMGSAMQAWFVDGSRMHLDAALNAYRMMATQTYATGGSGPDEKFEKPGSGKLLKSLTATHNSFETPCSTYALLKFARYLLQATGDGQYGDAMERTLWNAMFGSLPLEPDGRSFYYADYSNQAQRVYSDHIWPCCSGTYTQVAADYGISTWLLGPGDAVWVNLYLPSTMQWTAQNASLRLTQGGSYPAGEQVDLVLHANQPAHFSLRLRIPGWCRGASLRVNGQPIPVRAEKGFALIDRTWRNGDRVSLHLPASLRLEPFPSDGGPEQADLVALCWGPWVLLPLAPSPSARADDLLKAERIGPTEWRVHRTSGDVYVRPFFDVGEGTYSTYVRLV